MDRRMVLSRLSIQLSDHAAPAPPQCNSTSSPTFKDEFQTVWLIEMLLLAHLNDLETTGPTAVP
jgi:hypothetical protein